MDRTTASTWRERLGELAERHGVPGAVLGVLADGREIVLAHGVINVDTGVEATADTAFQIGSITKVWAATLALQLVDEGRLALDDPVARHLADAPPTGPSGPDLGAITVGQLLTHTSGIEGDAFLDTGRDDDAVARWVARLPEIGTIHEPGRWWSYSNSGFVVLGRIVEHLTGQPWHRALRDRLVKPLGRRAPVHRGDEALRLRATVGHLPDADTGRPRTTPWRMLPWSNAPAGASATASAADVLALARLHLDGGVATDGTRLLSADAVALMAAHHADQPRSVGAGQGLAWWRVVADAPDAPATAVGHDGNTVGHDSSLVVLPGHGVAVVGLTNSGTGRLLLDELVPAVVADLTGVALPPPAPDPPHPYPAARPFAALGTYRRLGVVVDVRELPEGVVAETTWRPPLGDGERHVTRLVPVDERLWIGERRHGGPQTFEFLPPRDPHEVFPRLVTGDRLLVRTG